MTSFQTTHAALRFYKELERRTDTDLQALVAQAEALGVPNGFTAEMREWAHEARALFGANTCGRRSGAARWAVRHHRRALEQARFFLGEAEGEAAVLDLTWGFSMALLRARDTIEGG